MGDVVVIPFNKWSKRLLRSGQKKATSRKNKRYGKPNDFFQVEDEWFIIDRVTKKRLLEVMTKHYDDEGAKNPQEFKEVWIQIHPRRGFVANDLVWYHEFHKADADEKTRIEQFIEQKNTGYFANFAENEETGGKHAS